MIIKGKSRGRTRQLAAHLLRRDQNESIRLYETRGTVASDVENALAEMEAHGAAVNCKRPVYHASISPEAHTPLTENQIRIAVDTLEETLGLDHQPRLVIVHRKNNREHVHVVWSRIDLEHNRAISDSWNYRHHEEAARALEALFGHRALPGSRHSARRQKDYERRQYDRSGVPTSAITAEITRLWNTSGDGGAFISKLGEAGYRLARGDRRAFVVVDRHGEVHSLARRIHGTTSRDIRAKLQNVDLHSLPSAAEVRMAGGGPLIAPVKRHFGQAAQEVSRRKPSHETLRGARARVQAPFMSRKMPMASVDSASSFADIAKRNAGRSAPATARLRYRSVKSILIAEFAAKIADARRRLPQDEVASAIERLLAERDAALDALRQTEANDGKRRRCPKLRQAKRPLKFPKLRFRRIRLKTTYRSG